MLNVICSPRCLYSSSSLLVDFQPFLRECISRAVFQCLFLVCIPCLKMTKRSQTRLIDIGSSGKSNIPGCTVQILHMVVCTYVVSWNEDL